MRHYIWLESQTCEEALPGGHGRNMYTRPWLWYTFHKMEVQCRTWQTLVVSMSLEKSRKAYLLLFVRHRLHAGSAVSTVSSSKPRLEPREAMQTSGTTRVSVLLHRAIM